METKNQLFIHPTDDCGKSCSFCVYADKRKDKKGFPHLDLEKGYAKASLNNLIKGAQHTAFSGGGEPLLNTDMISETIAMNPNKKYMVTTGLGLSIENIEKDLSQINDACIESNSLCVIRISLDSYHNNLDFDDNVDQVMKWFLDKRWERVRTCFIRGTVAEGALLLKNLKKYCKENKLFMFKKKINKYTYATIINKKFFQVILRPTIYPTEEELKKEDTLLKYIDNLLKIDTEEINLGKPRSCRGCKGCDSWKSGLENGLDITVNAKGDITLYGAEVDVLGNIYDEEITYDLLNNRVNDNDVIKTLQSYGIRDVMQAFLEDEVLGSETARINYPYAVIRELMEKNPERVKYVIRNLPNLIKPKEENKWFAKKLIRK